MLSLLLWTAFLPKLCRPCQIWHLSTKVESFPAFLRVLCGSFGCFFWRRVWLKSDVCVSVVRDPSVLLGEQETNHGPSPFNPVMVSGDPRDLLVIHHFNRKCRVVLSDSESNTWDKIVSTQSWIWVEFVTRLRILSNSTSISSFPTLWCPHAYRCLLWWKWAAVWLWGRILFNGCSIIQYQKEYKSFWQEVDWTHLTLNLKVQGNKSLSRFNS